MQEDRRHHERFMIDTAVTVARPEPALELHGRLRDVSADGVRVQCDAADAVVRIAVGDRVTVTAASGTCTGRVIRRKAGELAIVYDVEDAQA